MRLMSWNVNGLRAVHNKGLFVPFIEKFKPDILCLQETKARQHQSEVDLPEHEEYWNSADKKGYSGTAIFTKIKPKQVILGLPDSIVEKYDLASDGYGDPNKEGRVITAEYDDFFVSSVYTPNAKPDLSRLDLRHRRWDPAFLSLMKQLEKKKPVIFCGDLNVAHTENDLAHPKANEGEHGFTKEEREGIQALIDKGFIDTFRMNHSGNGYYTWWSHFAHARARNVGWRIDYFFASSSLRSRISRANIHPDVYGSDHCPISLEIKD